MDGSLAIRSLEVGAPEVGAGAFAIPDIPELSTVARRLDEEDETELRLFLSDPLVATISGSNGFGGQLERAAAIGYGPVPCRRCGGAWRRKLTQNGTERFVDWRDGTGYAPRDRFGKRVSYTTALARYRLDQQRLHGIVVTSYPTPSSESGVDAESAWATLVEAYAAQGKRLMTDEQLRELFPSVPEELCLRCSDCAGLGVVPRRAPKRHAEITVFPKGSSVQPGESDGDSRVHGSAHQFLAVAIVLHDVAALSLLARAALEGYYRPRDARAGRQNAWQALYELTPAGHEPEASRADEKSWQSRRAAQAAELYDHAARCWNFAAYGRGRGTDLEDDSEVE